MKKLKKILSCIMTLIMYVFLFSWVDFKEASAGTSLRFPTSKGELCYEISNNEVVISCYFGEDTELEIPSEIDGKSVTSIKENAFRGKTGLTSIIIPSSVTSIGDYAFIGCCDLVSMTIPSSVTNIGRWVFGHCSNLTSITIPDSVTSIGDYAFYSCVNLTDITIPNSVTSIGISAFFDCSKLSSIIIPNSVTSIGDSAFIKCYDLTSITIPSSVTSIGKNAFKDCNSINVNEDNKYFSSENGVLFNKDKSKLICYPTAKEEKIYIIPNSVTSIDDSAFSSCSNLTSITIPNSVTSIGNSAFYSCTSLESVIIPNSVTSIGNSAFRRCSNLTSVAMSNSVTSIEESTFEYCESLKSITIPDSITSIGNSAFFKCESLISIIIPNSVTSIEEHAFSHCEGLISIEIPDSITSIEKSVFSNCESLKSITIPDSVTSIGEWAFSNCESLKSITIPDSITSIEKGVFSGCDSLKSITIPDSITSIGEWAFSFCKGLISIEIPDSVTNIGSYAFYECKSLTNITIPNFITSIKAAVFESCKSLTSVIFPSSLTSIEYRAFFGCDSLESITIPNSVKSIEDFAFWHCDSLKSITIPDSVTSIEEDAFEYCDNLTIYGSRDSYAKRYAEDNSIPFKEIPSSNLSISSFRASKASPQHAGSQVTLIVQANGTGILQYKYYGYLNGKFTEIKDWSENNSVTISPSIAGIYDLWVAVKDSKGTIVRGNMNFTFTNPLLSISSITTDKKSPQYTKTALKLTTQASGGIGTLQYKYYRYLNGSYATIKDWSISSSVIIAPKTAGIYDLWVAVKDSKGTIVRKNKNFTFINHLGISSITTDKKSPQYTGTSVKLTTQASGGIGTLQYKYYSYLNGKYAEIKNWSTNSSVTITPKTEGAYDLWVAVKDETGTIIKKNIAFTFYEALEINKFTTDKASPQYVGTPVKLTVQAVGGKGTKQYKYYRYLNGSYAIIKDWSTNSSVMIAPKTEGTYDLWVTVKDETGTTVKKNIKFAFNKALEVNSLTTDKESPQYIDNSISITANASGGIGTLQYRFIVGNPDGTYSIIKDYSSSNTCNWIPSIDGNYTLYVDVKDDLEVTLRKSINYNIIFICKVNTENFRKAVGAEMYRLVNEHRNNNGVDSLTVDSVMEECAYEKSKHMSDNNYFSHDYNGKYWWDMYPEKYVNWSNLGENIVLSYTNPNKVYTREECKEIAEDLFTLWKNSPGHNANMLNADFKQIGFDVYVNSSGSIYGTQEFITRFK
ncbi:MAG: leucine-rich repeat protein [Clostridium sp.]